MIHALRRHPQSLIDAAGYVELPPREIEVQKEGEVIGISSTNLILF